ncbi:MAG: hypothetical protein ABIS01_03680, partial [Ferruginibacter sp.]
MRKLLSSILVLIVLLPACSNNAKTAAAEKENYQKAKETLEQKEKKNPVAFLSVNSRDRHNLLGQTVVKGEVSNTARVCTYKDVELQLS